MNQEQLKGILRQILLLLAGWLAGRGIGSAETWTAIFTNEAVLGAIIAVITGAWSYFSRSDKALVAAAAKTPAVAEITVTDPDTAAVAKAAAPTTQINVK